MPIPLNPLPEPERPRLVERVLSYLEAVMPDLPQLGMAMVVLAVAIAASRALAAGAGDVAPTPGADAAASMAQPAF